MLQRSVRYALKDLGLRLFFGNKVAVVFEYDASGISLPGFEVETSTQDAVRFFAETDSIESSYVEGHTARIVGNTGLSLVVSRPAHAGRTMATVSYALGTANPRLCEFFGYAPCVVFRFDVSTAWMQDACGLEIADPIQDAIAFLESSVAVDDSISYVTTDGLGAVLMGNSGRTLRIRHMHTEPDWSDSNLDGYRNSKTYPWRSENEDVMGFFNCAHEVTFLYDKRNHGDAKPAIRVYEDGDYRWALVLASHVIEAHNFFQNNDAIDFGRSRVENGYSAVLVGASDGFEIAITDTLKRAVAPSAETPD